MINNLFDNVYNPDVLSCLANLSNDEVFTPPEIVNQMLDTLPQELFSNPDTTFLDPACKTGVFLREIAKRLIVGLEPQFPDLQQRIDHIFHKQLFAISITELTSLLSRRSVYCSKYANSEFSVTKFSNADGNIRFKKVKHTWDTKIVQYDENGKKKGKCILCGASREEYDRSEELETHAYEFIHTDNLEKLFNMKFDVIISNPPYQMSDGSDSASAIPIYNKFIDTAKKLNPKYLTMIIPSRWMSGGKGLDSFRDEMLHDKHIVKLVDYFDSTQCFNGVSIKGGVCFFLRDANKTTPCKIKTVFTDKSTESTRYLLEQNCDVFIRWSEGVSIFHKVQNFKEPTFNTLVSARKPFGIDANFKKYTNSFTTNGIKVYTNKATMQVLIENIPSNKEIVDKYKIFITRGYGAGEDFPHQIINKPFIGEKGTCCSETYVVISPSNNIDSLKNIISYMKTKFFRFLVLLCKNTQDASSKVYRLVPLQDFSKPWTDKELYTKYGLTQEEIDFIESMIRPME